MRAAAASRVNCSDLRALSGYPTVNKPGTGLPVMGRSARVEALAPPSTRGSEGIPLACQIASFAMTMLCAAMVPTEVTSVRFAPSGP